MFVDLRTHCFSVAETCYHLGWGRSFAGSDWFVCAAGLEGVDFNIVKFEDQFGWCREADNQLIRDQTAQRSFVLELARFSLIWGGLEAAIAELELKGHVKKSGGKIAKVVSLLDKVYAGRPLVRGYDALLDEFYGARLKSVLGWPLKDIDPTFTAGSGLRHVYKVRNAMAHGDLTFPRPFEDEDPLTDSTHVAIAARLVLMTMQLVLSLLVAGDEPPICPSTTPKDTAFEVLRWLRNLHDESWLGDVQRPLPLEPPWCYL